MNLGLICIAFATLSLAVVGESWFARCVNALYDTGWVDGRALPHVFILLRRSIALEWIGVKRSAK